MDTTAPPRPADATARVHAAWAEHHERLWRAVYAWSGDPDVASDAVAEAFAQALRRGDAIEQIDRWVWRAAFRIAAGALKDRRATEPLPVGHEGEIVPDPAAAADDVRALTDALSRLAPQDRTIVVLALVGGWRAAEIADLTGSSAGAVRVRLHRARTRLRSLLEDHR